MSANGWRFAAAFSLPPSSFILRLLPGNIDDLAGMERLEKLPDGVEIELRIAGLNDEEKLVARCLIEALHVEDGVIRHRQSVEGEHAEDGGEGSHQNRALEGDRNPRWP